MAFDYTTAQDVFAYGNSAGTATDPINEAALMADLITGMSRSIDTYCNQQFSLATYSSQVLSALIDSDGILTCYPPVPTISAITAADWRQGLSPTHTTLSISALDIEEHAFGCVVRSAGNYLRYRGGRISMRLSYTGGWANLAAVPSDFEWAMRCLCWWAYQKRSAPTEQTAIPELGVLVIPGNWPPHIVGMFRNYVRHVVM